MSTNQPSLRLVPTRFEQVQAARRAHLAALVLARVGSSFFAVRVLRETRDLCLATARCLA